MNLTDFYNAKKIPVTSVNNKTGQVVLNATDIGAVSKKQIGINVPNLIDGKVPNTQLPSFAKLVNGKIVVSQLPIATNSNLGAVIIGEGFQYDQNGKIDAIGIISRDEKRQKFDIIKIDGNGGSVLTYDGTYKFIGNTVQTNINFDSTNENYDVYFYGKLPAVSLLAPNGKYYVLTDGDIQYDADNTILHMRRFLIDQNISEINGEWILYMASSIKYIDTDVNTSLKYRKLALTKALIYG